MTDPPRDLRDLLAVRDLSPGFLCLEPRESDGDEADAAARRLAWELVRRCFHPTHTDWHALRASLAPAGAGDASSPDTSQAYFLDDLPGSSHATP